MQLGQHGLKLRTVEHRHHRRLDDVIKVMSQRNLVAPQLLGLAVQVAPAHARAEIARVVLAAVGHVEHIRFKNLDRHVQQRGVLFDFPTVELVIAGIHHQKRRLKMHLAVALQFLHELGQQHGILAAGDAHGDPVALLNQLVALHSQNKRLPKLLAICGQDAPLHPLIEFKFAFHLVVSSCLF